MAAAVPAWRRLGLKLKNEGDILSQDQVAPPPEPSPAPKRKPLDVGNEFVEGRRQATGHSKRQKRESNGSDATPNSAPVSRPKSVTFTDDTKSAPESPTIPAEDLHPPPQSSEDVALRKQLKREKRKARRESQAFDPSNEPSKPYLAYLRDYTDARESWKFNKSHQNQLFKYILDVRRIPPTFDLALFDYLSGLRGQEARKRIGSGAQQLLDKLKNDPDAMDAPDERRLWREAALSRDAAILKAALKRRIEAVVEANYAKEFPEKLQKRRRVEAVIEALNRSAAQVTTTPQEKKLDTQPTPPARPNEKKRSRGRKRRGLRTGVPDDDEISSTSSSNISSSESDDDDKDQKGKSK